MSLLTHDLASVLDGAAPLDFRKLGDFSGGAVGVFRSVPGTSPWEMHPDGEELPHVLEGRVDIEVLPAEGPSETVSLASGSVLVVPRGRWHRHKVREPLAELYATCGRTLSARATDPRNGRERLS